MHTYARQRAVSPLWGTSGRNRGRQRWVRNDCRRTFGPTLGTPLYGLHTAPEETARTLLIVMRRGSLWTAEEISGHKWETINGGCS